MLTEALEETLPEETATTTIEVVALRSVVVSNLTTVTTPGGENTATVEPDIVAPAEEEEFVPEPGSLILLGGRFAHPGWESRGPLRRTVKEE